MFQSVFAVVLLMAVCRSAALDDDPASPRKYCGQRLSRTLSAVCRGVYNTLNKSDEIYARRERRSLELPLTTKEAATSLFDRWGRRRRKRGIVNECCEKPCSFEELSSYCGARRPRKE